MILRARAFWQLVEYLVRLLAAIALLVFGVSEGVLASPMWPWLAGLALLTLPMLTSPGLLGRWLDGSPRRVTT